MFQSLLELLKFVSFEFNLLKVAYMRLIKILRCAHTGIKIGSRIVEVDENVPFEELRKYLPTSEIFEKKVVCLSWFLPEHLDKYKE